MQEIIEAVRPFLSKMSGGNPNVGACCPFHEDPNSSSPSFSMNVDTGLWQCFGCGLTGNLGTFLRRVGLSRTLVDAVVLPLTDQIRREEKKRRVRWGRRFHLTNPFLADPVLPSSLLGLFDYLPVRLLSSGFNRALLNEIEVGFDKNERRIIFPIRDVYGNLAGVSGRAVDAGALPRYKVYEGRRRLDGEWLPGDFGPGFDETFPTYHIKSKNYLWNADRVCAKLQTTPDAPVVLTEGYKACLWTEQETGFLSVALMGTSIGATQVDILLYITDGPIIILLDGDKAGRQGTERATAALKRCANKIYVVELPERQPDNYPGEALVELLDRKEGVSEWKRRKREQYKGTR